jgi:GxxExxY protein
MLLEQELTEQIIGACIEVHEQLGPGLLESTYALCLVQELRLRELECQREVSLPVRYKGIMIECGYRLDIVIAGKVVVELKAVDKILPVHEAQLITYLKLSGYRIGLLVNFNVKRLVDGIVRRVV